MQPKHASCKPEASALPERVDGHVLNPREAYLPHSTRTGIGIDHIRLSYHYLDAGDLEDYGSLLADTARLRHPGASPAHGRGQVLRLQAATLAGSGRHTLFRVYGEGDDITVVGRYTPLAAPAASTDFVDVFTLSDEALILEQRRFLDL
jgi:hypothetical protein